MFVLLNEGYDLNSDLKAKIKQTLREKTSPRHVPRLYSKLLRIVSLILSAIKRSK